MQTDRSYAHILQKEKKKVVKTWQFPAACGLPTIAHPAAEHSANTRLTKPSEALKMLFIKIKHITSLGVKEPFYWRGAQDPV